MHLHQTRRMRVKAAILHRIGCPLEIETIDLAMPNSGEVLVSMQATGVCHSDYHVMSGDTLHPLPAALGHEGAGIIEQIGEGVEGLKVGDHVILSWAPACGACFYCQHDKPNLCRTFTEPIWNGTMLDGTTRFSNDGQPVFHYCGLGCFPEKVVVPAIACVKVSAELPFEIGALIGCAVTTGVGSVLKTAKIAPGSIAVVIGCGGVGLSTIMGCKIVGAKTIIAVDPLESRRLAALECGADIAVAPGEAFTTIRDLTDSRGADAVFEAVGNPKLQETAVEWTRPGGVAVLSGLSPMGTSSLLSGAKLTREEKTIMGSYYGTADPQEDFPKYAEMYLTGKLPLEKLISHRYPLNQINQAFDDMLTGKSRRGVVIS